jgi:hypothetical protein
MVRTLTLLALAASIAGCSLFRKAGIADEPPAHQSPRTTTIFGDWILKDPDSTAFAGANQVELQLQPTTFTIIARYPNAAPVTITGVVTSTETGGLVLTPKAGLNETTSRWRELQFVPGHPLTLVASAAGNTLVFAPPPQIQGGQLAVNPSSVWHKKTAAEAAGMVERDSTP